MFLLYFRTKTKERFANKFAVIFNERCKICAKFNVKCLHTELRVKQPGGIDLCLTRIFFVVDVDFDEQWKNQECMISIFNELYSNWPTFFGCCPESASHSSQSFRPTTTTTMMSVFVARQRACEILIWWSDNDDSLIAGYILNAR